MRKLLVVLIALGVCLGCRNPYTDYYKELRPQSQVRDPNIMLPAQGLEIREASDPVKDSKEMARSGYAPIGYSSFNSGGASEDMLREHAAKIGAAVVLVYRTQTASMVGSSNYFMPSLGMSISVPQEHRRFDFLAQYFAKQNPNSVRFGAYYENLTPEQKLKIQSNKGAVISIVIRGTPAYQNDFLEGDIIRSVNDVQVEDAAHFGKLLAEHEGKVVSVGIIRGEEPRRIDVQLNKPK
jgi:S1-C subfamily serine protease